MSNQLSHTANDYSNLPAELVERKQWICWRYVERDGAPKKTKVPFTVDGEPASTTRPETWSTFDCAVRTAAHSDFAGIGFVFTVDDPFCGVDLDCIWQSDADEGAPWALRILERFADTYSEVSPSEQGVKIWCRARPPRCGKWPIAAGGIEIYDHSRYFTVTGRSAGVIALADHQVDVEALVANLDQDRTPQDRILPSGGTKARVIPCVIPRGQRHTTLVSMAGSMYRRGMTPEAIESALLVINRTQCDPPYAPEHIRQIVTSMSRWTR
jgi:hypothetical protein